MRLTLTEVTGGSWQQTVLEVQKERVLPKSIIQNKAGKKSTFLLSLFLESKGLSSSDCY